MNLNELALLAIIPSTICFAKPIVNLTPNTRGGIVKTITESWQMSEDEKKNIVMKMSRISATAIAPTMKIKRGVWKVLISEHKACFYNTFGATMQGRYVLKLNVAGVEVNAFDVVPVGGGQAFCVTRYLQLLVKGQTPGDTPSIASTHVEMDGNASDNEGHGVITVR